MKYPVILADPPWKHDWHTNTGPEGRAAAKHYPVMSTEAICALRPPAADNAAMFLWACWPMLADALKVIDAWGFTYRTVAWPWVKMNKSNMGFFFGLGYYTRANTEPCLLGVRGSMPPAVKDVQALICSPVQAHSRKPDEQYGKIERLYPTGPYLEMFARRPRPGWTTYGNELDGKDISLMIAGASTYRCSHVWGNEVVSDLEIAA